MSLPKITFRFLLYFVKKQKFKFLTLMLMSVIWASNDALFPFFIKGIINAVQNYHGPMHGVYSAVSTPLILLVLFWLANEIAARIQGITMIYTFPIFRSNIRADVFKYVRQHSHEYFSEEFAGNIANKISDLPTSSQTAMEIICFQFTTAAVGSIIVLIMMWLTNPIFAAILLIWLILHFGFTAIFLKFGGKLWGIHADSVSTLTGKIVDIFTNIMTVRLFSRGKFESAYLQTYQQDEINKAKKAMLALELTRAGMGISGLFLIFGMVFMLLYGWTHDWVTIGDFTQVAMQTFWLLGWIWFVSFQITVFAREAGTISNALTLVRRGHDIVDKENAKPLNVSHGEIVVDNASFAYQKNKAVFEDLNLIIPSGQKVGLVGFSGSGKTTLINLILRFYDLNKGRILIDGQDINDVTQESLRSQIAMIPQDPSLFHRTLMENIRYGKLDATDEEVIATSKLAHCHEFIERLDDNYYTMVGERGIKLSGGQRQRIAIARAILKNAPILILDEATSSLDSVTEKLIQESLQGLMKNRTTLVVAHRLSTLADMDRILVFHKGQLVEDGTKEELLKADGHFAHLWKMQTNGFLPDEGD